MTFKISLFLLFLTFYGAAADNVAKAYYGGGCFWGVEYYMEKEHGVKDAVSGYMGGFKENPSYYDVSSKKSGHIEVVEVTYDPSIISYESLTKLFFEIHDPTQVQRQGPDIGEQYSSVIFYTDNDQKNVAEKLINILKSKGYSVATQLRPAKRFWKAESYHQDYYQIKNKQPYCHGYTKRF